MERLSDKLGGILGATVVGILGGWSCAFLILTFGNIIGRSGNSDSNYVGYWDPGATAGLAAIYGIPLGIVLFDLSYAKFLQSVSVKDAVRASFFGTLGGGLLGALGSPILAALIGSMGFVLASAYVAEHGENKREDSSRS